MMGCTLDIACLNPNGLGGHVVDGTKAGTIALRPGLMLLAGNTLKITFHGEGAHAAQPCIFIDPVLMAVSFFARIQGVVSRELAWAEKAILTVTSIQVGDVDNVIPAEAVVLLHLRIQDEGVRAHALGAIEGTAQAEGRASGALNDPDIQPRSACTLTVNDEECMKIVTEAFQEQSGKDVVQQLLGLEQASEDVRILATAAYCLYVIGRMAVLM